MNTETTSAPHPLRATFKSTVDAILANQVGERGQPPLGPKGEKRDGWTWRQEDSVELITTLTIEVSSLANNDGEIKDADLAVFRDLINHPINPSAFRQRLEDKGRVPKGEGRKSLKQSNADLF